MTEILECYCCMATYKKGSDCDAGQHESGSYWCTDCLEGSEEADLEEAEDNFLNASEDNKVDILLKLYRTLSDRDKQVFLKRTI